MGSQVTTMSRPVGTSRRHRPLLAAATAATALAALVALTGCSTGAPSSRTPSSGVSDNGTVSAGPSDGSSGSAGTSGSATPPQDGSALAEIVTSPTGRAVSPTAPVTVAVTGGTLTSVTMHNGSGKHVTGRLADDGSSWHTTEVLGYGKDYTITAEAVNGAGTPTTKTSHLTTLTPGNLTMPYLWRTGGAALTDGAKYGVGIVPIVHFDEPITDEAAAEKTLSVTTSPHVEGSWYWSDDQDAHWRPERFWQPGTKVTVSAKVYGVQVSPGLYGQSDISTSFTIGRKQITRAFDNAPKAVNKVRVYNAAGDVIRTMNTSMGEHSGTAVNGNYINFYTLDGTYTVIGHENPASMCSDSYGLPADAPGGYACEDIPWATKISVDGIYLHELDTTVWAQDHGQDVSHGCLNLNHDNALWFYKHSQIGDPVVVHGAKGAPKIQVWQGGDWSVPWSKWVAGSALS